MVPTPVAYRFIGVAYGHPCICSALLRICTGNIVAVRVVFRVPQVAEIFQRRDRGVRVPRRKLRKQDRWAQIEAGELAEFKRKQEQTCSEGIIALQQQKNAAISQRTEELRIALEAEVDAAFMKIAQNLSAAQQSLPTIKEE